MTALWIGLAVGLFGAVCAVAVPKILEAVRVRRTGTVTSSLQLDSLNQAGPEVLLVPDHPRPPPDVPSPLDFAGVRKWQREHGAVHLGWQAVRLVIRGQGPRPVILTGFDPVVIATGTPVAGWFVAPELGGGQEINLLVADLDEQRPTARLWRSENGDARLSDRFAFSVTETDVEYFEFHVFSTESHVSWGIDISYEADGKAGVLKVRDDQLRLTAESRQSKAFSDGPSGAWIDASWGEGFSLKAAQRWRTYPRG